VKIFKPRRGLNKHFYRVAVQCKQLGVATSGLPRTLQPLNVHVEPHPPRQSAPSSQQHTLWMDDAQTWSADSVRCRLSPIFASRHYVRRLTNQFAKVTHCGTVVGPYPIPGLHFANYAVSYWRHASIMQNVQARLCKPYTACNKVDLRLPLVS